jgi:hypothetical protein
MQDYLNMGNRKSIGESAYNPEIKEEGDFWDIIRMNGDLSWNFEGFGDVELEGHYICYETHELYSHNHWAIEDVLYINYIPAEVGIRYLCDKEKLF